jgi:hypothetical protein
MTTLAIPCWFELATNDRERALMLYSRLFGYTLRPMGLETNDGFYLDYSALHLGENIVGGAYPLTNEQLRGGQRSHWLPYFSVAEIGPAAERVRALGGTVLLSPVQVRSWGRMALVRDPWGARFALWQPLELPLGLPEGTTPGLPQRCDLFCSDVSGAAAFYTGLLGIKQSTVALPKGSAAVLLAWRSGAWTIADPRLLGLPISAQWVPGFGCADVAAGVAQVTALKGQVLAEPQPLAGIGTYAVVADGQGAVLGLFGQ